ncbi:MAG: hypothetical protein FWD48_08265 [Oscillospiraceae bacterium]|nr:hypothetical protein [Oscillospiraceae bacterium]
MQQLNRSLPFIETPPSAPEKALVFGGGAFWRALVFPVFDALSKSGFWGGGVTLVGDNLETFEKQDGLFTVAQKGIENGKEITAENLIACVTDCVNPHSDYNNYIKRAYNPELRFVVSDESSAENITALLHERFSFFDGDINKGLIFLSFGELKKSVQKYAAERNLNSEFSQWLGNACFFANTLADRIITETTNDEAERSQKKFGYRDELLTMCEAYYFWAIESPVAVRAELPLDKSGLNVFFCEDITPHYLRKTRLFGGIQAALAPAALLFGCKTMHEAATNPSFKKYIERALLGEIIPTLDTNRNVLESYAKTVTERLCNPLIKHELLSVTQNCVPKFKTQVLPTILEYRKRFAKLPPILTFSFAALIAFYKSGGRFPLNDNEKNIAFLRDNKLDIIFRNISSAWGADMTDLLENTQFKATVEEHFSIIKKHGVKPLVERLVT